MRRFILGIALAFSSSIKCQDAYFTSFQRSLLYTNPAFAGTAGTARFQTASNFLWPGLNGYFSIYGALDAPIGKRASGGLYFSKTYSGGVSNKLDVGGAYALRFSLFNKKINIQPALAFSFLKSSITYNNLLFGSQINPNYGFTNAIYPPNKGLLVKSNLDMSAGLLVYNPSFFVSLLVRHITQPDEGYIGPQALPMLIGIQFAKVIHLNDELKMIPALTYNTQQDFQLLRINTCLLYKKICAGIQYSNNKSISLLFGFQNKDVSATISHSMFNGNNRYSVNYGAFEINLSSTIKWKEKDERICYPLIGF